MEVDCISTLLCGTQQINQSFVNSEKLPCEADASSCFYNSPALSEDRETVRSKNVTSRGGHVTTLNAVNKSAAQIKKPPHRKSSSPLNWFPRKKTDSFLERKIKLLQEVGGMNSSLDKTLGDSYPHYSRVEREKIAARAAAHTVMEARKAAMVEASWCRILKAARIQSKDAELRLEKAERSVEEAFNAASAVGVTMNDKPDGPKHPCEIETSSTTGGGSTHTITASFETAFEVDKEVAAAVKMAFIRLANCPTSDKDKFGANRDLLRKISQNPDYNEIQQESDLGLSSECESEIGSESEIELIADSFVSDDMNLKTQQLEKRRGKCNKNRHNSAHCAASNGSRISAKLVDTMVDRIKLLQEDELTSLATIVATCGLNAILEVENSKQQHDLNTAFKSNMPSLEAGKMAERHSKVAAYFPEGQLKRKQDVTELPSLENFLVKHVSRLEREVQEAKNTRRNAQTAEVHNSGNGWSTSSEAAVQDLGSVLAKHVLRIEKDIEEAKQSAKASEQVDKENVNMDEKVEMGVVKCMSRLERAKLEALKSFSVQDSSSLDKVLVKHVHRLEREKAQALTSGKDCALQRDQKKEQGTTTTATDFESLDKVLVKHVSKLEKEKMVALDRGSQKSNTESVGSVSRDGTSSSSKIGNNMQAQRNAREREMQEAWGGLSLGNSLRSPHLSKLERGSQKSSTESVGTVSSSDGMSSSEISNSMQVHRNAREREMQETWGGLSLGNSLRPHLSKLERDKAAWRRAEEEERRRAREQ